MIKPMKWLSNQLNKVKNFSGRTSKSQTHDIDSNTATEFIRCILNEEASLDDKSLLVANTDSGILYVGLSLCNPSIITSIIRSQNVINETLRDNLSNFDVSCDFLVASYPAFDKHILDIGIVGPNLDKSKTSDITEIIKISECVQTVYCMYPSNHFHKLNEKLPNATKIGAIKIKMPGSSDYYNQNIDGVEHLILKIDA
jgi:hypothetical protein